METESLKARDRKSILVYAEPGNYKQMSNWLLLKGSSINDVTALGVRGSQGFYDNSNKALGLKAWRWGEEVSKIIENCVTSFMDDPKRKKYFVLKETTLSGRCSIATWNSWYDMYSPVKNLCFIGAASNITLRVAKIDSYLTTLGQAGKIS